MRKVPIMALAVMSLAIATAPVIAQTQASEAATADQLFQAGRYADAALLYEAILSRWPNNPNALLQQANLAISYIRVKNYEAAGPVARSLMVNFVGDARAAQALSHIADAYRDQRRYSEAIQFYGAAADKQPQSADAMWAQTGIVVSAISSGDSQTAQTAIDTLKANYANQAEFPIAIRAIGDNYRWRGDHGQAADLYKCAIAAKAGNPDGVWAQMGLAISSICSGDSGTAAGAIGTLKTQYRSDSHLAQALYEPAYAYSNNGQYSSAAQLFNYVIATCGDAEYTTLSKAGLGLIQLRQGSLDDSTYQQVLGGSPTYPSLTPTMVDVAQEYYNRGVAQLRQGWLKDGGKSGLSDSARQNLEKAITLWERIGFDMPESSATARAVFGAALCAAQDLHDYEKGVGYFKQLVEKWPDYQFSWYAQYAVGIYTERMANSAGSLSPTTAKEIEQAYEAVMQKYPDSNCAPVAALKLGQIYAGTERWTQAIPCIEKFLEANPARISPRVQGDAIYDLARAYENTGKTQAAMELYHVFVGITDPGDRRVQTLRTRLNVLRGEKP